MGGIVLDTNVLIDAQNNNFDFELLPDDDEAFLPTIVISELYVGVNLQTDPAVKNQMLQFVDSIVNSFKHLDFTPEVAVTHAKIVAEIKILKRDLTSDAFSKWENKNAHDVIIGGTALHYGYPVITRNESDFKIIDGLSVIQTSTLYKPTS